MNQRCFLLIIGVFSFFLSSIAYSREMKPNLPYVQKNKCQGESCRPPTNVIKEVNQRPLKVYLKPLDRKKVSFEIPIGQSFKILRQDLYTLEAAPYRLTQEDVFGTQTEGPKCDDPPFPLKKGDTIYILSYSGEGYWDAWYKGKTFFCSFHSDSENIEDKVKRERWLEIKYQGKRGWVTLPGHCVDVNGMEECGF